MHVPCLEGHRHMPLEHAFTQRRYDECVGVAGLRESVKREYSGRKGNKRERWSDTVVAGKQSEGITVGEGRRTTTNASMNI